MARAKSILVVELADRWVKLCQLTPKGNGWQVGKLAYQEATGEEELTSWLKGELASLRDRPKSLIALVPRHQVMIRHIRLPSRDPEEIVRMTALQISNLVPYAAQEAVWGSQAVRSDAEGYSDCLVAVVPRADIQRLLRIIQAGGVGLDRVTVSSLGLIRWARAMIGRKSLAPEGVTVLVNLDLSTLEIDLLEGSDPLFTRATPFAPQGLPEALISEIRRTLATAARETVGKQVGQVILTGMVLALEPVAQRLREELHVEVEVLDPFELLNGGSPPEGADRCSYTELVGIALEAGETDAEGKMSLLLPEVLNQRAQRKVRFQWAATLSILGMAVLSGTGAMGWPVLSQGFQLNQVKRHIRSIAPAVEEIEGMRQQIDIARGYRLAQGMPLKVLRELYAAVPMEVALTLVILDAKDNLLLKGQAPSISDVNRLVTDLEKSPLFHHVQARYINKRAFQDQEVADFEIQCPLALEGSDPKGSGPFRLG